MMNILKFFENFELFKTKIIILKILKFYMKFLKFYMKFLKILIFFWNLIDRLEMKSRL
jgi:hypothetical protein